VSTSVAETDPDNNDPPVSAIDIDAAMTNFTMEGCVFDGGSIGWGSWALDGTGGKVTNVRIEGLSLLRGADVSFDATSTGFINPSTTSGAVRVNGIG
jgi:hypothetical protein